jgi:hypothetical protein
MLFGNPSEEKGVEEMGYFRQKSQNYYKKNQFVRIRRHVPIAHPNGRRQAITQTFFPSSKNLATLALGIDWLFDGWVRRSSHSLLLIL